MARSRGLTFRRRGIVRRAGASGLFLTAALLGLGTSARAPWRWDFSDGAGSVYLLW